MTQKPKILNLKSKIKHLLSSRKLRLMAIGVLILFLSGLVYASLMLRKDAEASWWSGDGSGSWLKRQKLTIVNSNATESLAVGTTIAVTVDTKSLVSQGKLQSDCDDLRILYQDGSTTTVLDRYISYPGGGSCGTSEASKVYFKIYSNALDAAESDTNYYMYYGSPHASAPSNPDNAFDIGAKEALLVCPFDGTTTCAAGETPSTESGAIRYSGSKSALSFDGNGDYVEFPTSYTSLDNLPNNDFTIEWWQYFTSLPSQYFHVPFFTTQDCSDDGFQAYSEGGNNLTFNVRYNTTDSLTKTNTGIPKNAWAHIAIVFNSSTKTSKIYFNGTEASYTTQTPGDGTYRGDLAPLQIGKTGCSGGNYRGLIDEFRISNIIRYTTGFTPQTAPIVRDEYTKLLLHFDENGSDPRQSGKVFDDSGNGNHGTISGAKYVAGLVGSDNTLKTEKLELQISSLDDDGTSTANDGVWHNTGTYDDNYTSTNYFPLGGKEGDGNVITTGLRFRDVQIEQGTSITTAKLDFMESWGGNYSTNVKNKIYASAEDDCILGSANIPSSKTKTGISIDWDSNGTQTINSQWYQIDSAVPPPDIATVIQEVVNRPGWKTGNDICILIEDDGSTSDWWFSTTPAENWSISNAAKLELTFDASSYDPEITRGYANGGHTYGGHEGIFLEEGTTNKITNPSYEHSTYSTGWTISNGITASENSTSKYVKFGSSSIKLDGFFEGYGEDNVNVPYTGLYHNTSTKRYAQGFKVDSDSSVSSVVIPTIRSSSGLTTVSMRMEIQTNSSGLPSGTPVTNGTSNVVLTSSIPVGGNETTFSFSTPPSLTANTQYHLVLKAFTDVDGTIEQSAADTDSVKWALDYSNSTYANGSYAVMSDSNVWTANTLYDFVFNLTNTDAMQITTSINAGNTNSHTLSAYVYNMSMYTSLSSTFIAVFPNSIDATVASLVFNGSVQTTTYTDMGGGWWRLSYSGAAGSGSQDYGIAIQPGKVIYVDGVQLEEKNQWASMPYATTYIDGSMGTGYAWAGTANESTSTRTGSYLAYNSSGNVEANSGAVSFWIKRNPSYEGDVFLWSESGGQNTYSIYAGSTTSASFLKRVGGDQTNLSGTLNYDVWAHVVATWSNSTGMQFCINNSCASNASTTVPTNLPSTFNIGTTFSPIAPNGVISDYRIFNSALSTDEIQDLYYAGLVSHSDNYEVDAFSDDKGQNPVGLWHFDEAYGTTAHDSSRYGNDLTVSGAYWHSTSPQPNTLTLRHLHYDGTDDYAYQNFDREFDFGTDGFTLQGWFQHPSTPPASGTHTLISRYGTAGWKVYMNSSGYLCFGVDDDSSWDPDYSACSTVSYADSNWHHFDAVKDTSTITLYIDGNQVAQTGSVSLGSLSSSAKLYIGIDSDGTSNPWDADIDEVAIYPYAKTATQIKTDLSSSPIASSFGMSLTGLEQGLVGYWKMDENTGTTTSDSSGNDNTSSAFSGNATWATGKFGTGITFDGTDDVVRIVESTSTDLGATTDSYTVSAWFKTSADYSSNAAIVCKNANDPAYPYCLLLDSSERVFFRMYGGSDATAISSTSYNDGNWHHAVGVRDVASDKVYLYIDGIFISEGNDNSTTTAANDSDITIGNAWTSYTDRDFNGQIDEVRIYKRTLTPAEVGQLYNWAPGPVGHWKMDENTGTNAYDSSGNGNTSVLTLGPTWTTGKFGSGVKFDGSDDYSQSSFAYYSNFTAGTWIKVKSGSSSNQGIIQSCADSGGCWQTQNYTIRIYSGVLEGLIKQPLNAQTIVSSGLDVRDNQWHYVVLNYDGANLNIYVDGILKGQEQTATAPATGSDSLRIGHARQGLFGDDSNYYLDGTLDNVVIYNYARTPAQIISDMNAGHPAPGSPVGSSVLKAHLDEGYGDTANNSGSGGSTYNVNLGGSDSCPGASACPTWTNSGKFGKAIDFSGTQTADGDVHSRLSNNSFDAHTEGTISLWVKPDDTGDPTQTIFGAAEDDDDVLSDYLAIHYRPGNNWFRLQVNNNGSNVLTGDSSALSTPTNWHHIVVTMDANGNRMYINGQQQTLSYSVGNSSTNVWFDDIAENTTAYTLGCLDSNASDTNDCYNGDFMYEGLIDEVNVFNSALTGAQVQQLYNQGQSAVFGAKSTDSSGNASWSATDEYCPPGQGSTCTAPVGEWKFDENTGTTSTYDSSGNGNTGTLNGSMTVSDWVPGVYGSALNFDGSDDYVSIADNSSLNLTTSFTVSGWFKKLSSTTNDFLYSSGTQINRWEIWFYEATDKLRFSENAIADYEANTAITDSGWHHFAVVKNGDSGTNVTFYIDGALDGTASVGTVNTPSGTKRIADVSTGGASFDGNLDNIRIYNYARTPAQVAWEYNRGAPVGWWKLDECTGTTANDSSGNGLTGTISPGSTGGTNDAVGTCNSGDSTEMWNNGTTGKRGSSLDFDGDSSPATDSDYVEVADNSLLDFSNDFSISAWVNRDTANTQDAPVSKQILGGSGYHFLIPATNDIPRFTVSDGTNTSMVVGTTAINTPGWYHLVGVYTANGGTPSTTRIYVNGRLEGSTVTNMSPAGIPNASVFRIGTQSDGLDPFDGRVDEVKVFNYSLNAQQVRDEYGAGAVNFGY